MVVPQTSSLFLKPLGVHHPNCVVIIKYPQWYDKYHLLGYDVIRDTDAFDAIWIGTETRGPDTPRFGYVPTYQSAVAYRWLRDIGREKTRGGWFDPYDCTPDEYVDQAYATVLAGATELMRFNGFDILPAGRHAPLMAEFAKHRPYVEALAKRLAGRSPLGIYAYKPPYSSSGNEEYIFDFIGNLGIPLLPVARFPASRAGATIILTRAARHDAAVDQKCLEWVDKGGSIIATVGFLADAADKVHALFGIDRVQSEPIEAGALFVHKNRVAFTELTTLGGVLNPTSANVLMAGQVGDRRVPILTRATTPAGGFAAVLNLRTHGSGDQLKELLTGKPVLWMDWPDAAIQVLRELALTNTGLRLVAPSSVLAYPFTGDLLALINVRKTETRIRLKLSPPWYSASVQRLTIHPDNKQVLPADDGTFELMLAPRARWTLTASTK